MATSVAKFRMTYHYLLLNCLIHTYTLGRVEGDSSKGRGVKLGELPHYVIIDTPTDEAFRAPDMCSGTLIHLQWVLTSASCLPIKGVYEIYAGIVEYDPTGIGYQKRDGDFIAVYPDGRVDLGLLKAGKSFEETKYVKVLPLQKVPWGSENKTSPCLVSGFGTIRDPRTEGNIHLVPVDAGLDLCTSSVRKLAVFQTICLNSKQKQPNGFWPDPCLSDSGSLLLCDGKGFGVSACMKAKCQEDSAKKGEEEDEGCTELVYQSVYVYLYPYLDWINSYAPVMSSGSPSTLVVLSGRILSSLFLWIVTR